MTAANGSGRPETRAVDRQLIAGLARAIDWIDSGLQNVLQSRGFTPVHRTQSLILLHLASGIDRPADMAREMGLTRQNVHQMAKGLIADGLIEQVADASDPRRSRYQWTKQSAEIRRAALDTLGRLEAAVQVRARASDSDMRAFRRVLSADWGPAIGSDEELQRVVQGRAPAAPGAGKRGR